MTHDDEVRFIRFGEYDPDSPRFGEGSLDVVHNMLPLFGGYRPIKSYQLDGNDSGASTTPMLGGLCYVYTNTGSSQHCWPIEDFDEGDDKPLRSDATCGDLYDLVDERNANDSEYYGITASGAQAYSFKLSPLDQNSTALDISVRYQIENNESGQTWRVDVYLYHTDTTAPNMINDASTAWSATATTTDVTWTTFTHTLTGTEVPRITAVPARWEDLWIKVVLTSVGAAQTAAPDEDDWNPDGWVDGSRGSTNIYQSIDESVTDDDDFIRSPRTGVGRTARVRFGIASVDEALSCETPESLYTLNYRRRQLSSSNNWSVVAEIEDGNGNSVQSNADTGMTTSFADHAFVFTEGLTGFDMDTLKVKILATNEDAAESYKELIPNNTRDQTGLTLTPGGGNAHEKVDDLPVSDDTDYITHSNGSSTFEGDFEAFGGYPRDGGTWKLKIRARLASPGSSTLETLLHQGSGTLVTVTDTVTSTSWSWFETSLTADEAGLFNNSFDIRFTQTQSGGAADIEVSHMLFELPWTQDVLDISRIWMDSPGKNQVKISQIQGVAPSPVAEHNSDKVRIYTGNSNRLQCIEDGTWNNVRAYAYGANPPEYWSWSMIQWGQDVIATNYTDPVQWVQAPAAATTLFADCITSTDKPKAAVVAAIGPHVVLGNINFAGGTNHTAAGRADEVWWSAFENPQDFDVDPGYTGCDFQILATPPGSVTAITSGQKYGLVFKRNSITRMEYVGGGLIFRFELVSDTIGCPAPRSIVKVGDDVYFWHGSGFAVVRGNRVEMLGEEISQFLVENEALPTTEPTMLASNDAVPHQYSPVGTIDAKTREEDAMMLGAYDWYSKCIFWSYMGYWQLRNQAEPDFHENDHWIVYNTVTGKWSSMNGSSTYTNGHKVSALVQWPCVPNDDSYITKGLRIISARGSRSYVATFSGDLVKGRVSTKVISFEDGVNVKINAVRLIYDNLPVDSALSTNDNYKVTIIHTEKPVRENVATDNVTVQYRDRTDDGWIPVEECQGEFFRFNVITEDDNPGTVRHLVGLQIRYSELGKR